MDTSTFPELQLEYQELRKEILQNQSAVTTIIGFVLTACGVLFSAAVGVGPQQISDGQRGLLMLAAGVIVLIAMYEALARERSTVRIASYIREFVEPELPLARWETSVSALNDIDVASPKRLRDRLGLGLRPYNALVVFVALSGVLNLMAIYYGVLTLTATWDPVVYRGERSLVAAPIGTPAVAPSGTTISSSTATQTATATSTPTTSTQQTAQAAEPTPFRGFVRAAIILVVAFVSLVLALGTWLFQTKGAMNSDDYVDCWHTLRYTSERHHHRVRGEEARIPPDASSFERTRGWTRWLREQICLVESGTLNRVLAKLVGHGWARGYLALAKRPRGRSIPGVLVVQERRGLDADTRALARRLAQCGCAALAIDLSVGRADADCLMSLLAGGSHEHPRETTSRAVHELSSAKRFLEAKTGGAPVRVIGFCRTGGCVLKLDEAGGTYSAKATSLLARDERPVPGRIIRTSLVDTTPDRRRPPTRCPLAADDAAGNCQPMAKPDAQASGADLQTGASAAATEVIVQLIRRLVLVDSQRGAEASLRAYVNGLLSWARDPSRLPEATVQAGPATGTTATDVGSRPEERAHAARTTA